MKQLLCFLEFFNISRTKVFHICLIYTVFNHSTYINKEQAFVDLAMLVLKS